MSPQPSDSSKSATRATGANISLQVVPSEKAGERLDKFLSSSIKSLSRAQIQQLIHDGNVRVDGKPRKPHYLTRPGEVVTVEIPPPANSEMVGEDIPLDILYEDESILVINKPAGMVVHPAVGHPGGTLANAVLGRIPGLDTSPVNRPGIVHRLDRDTSGVVLIAKTDAALRALQAQFAAREVHKVYLALVHGTMETRQGRIEAAIGRDPHDRKKMAVTSRGGRQAVTVFRVIRQFDKYALLQVEPATGRTHQIRVHLAFIKHPVVGDSVYGKKAPASLELERQFLHAALLRFRHPVTGVQVEVAAPLPGDLRRVLMQLDPSLPVSLSGLHLIEHLLVQRAGLAPISPMPVDRS